MSACHLYVYKISMKREGEGVYAGVNVCFFRNVRCPIKCSSSEGLAKPVSPDKSQSRQSFIDSSSDSDSG